MSVFRRTGMTTVAVLVGIVLVLVVIVAAAPAWARGAGLDVWNLGAARADEQAAFSRRGELEDQHDRLWEQVAAGDRVVEQMIDGRLALADAVPELARINADRPGFVEGLRCHHRDLGSLSDRALIAVYAVEKTERRLRDEPGEKRAAVLARLEGERAAIK